MSKEVFDRLEIIEEQVNELKEQFRPAANKDEWSYAKTFAVAALLLTAAALPYTPALQEALVDTNNTAEIKAATPKPLLGN